MLYKEDIMKILKDMNLPLNEYWITSEFMGLKKLQEILT